AGSRRWRWFELSGDDGPGRGDAPLLFLPPVIHTAEQGRPLERVEFRRDELANLAWATEQTVESDAGRPVDRQAPRVTPSPSSAPADQWRFRLSTDVPDSWMPLVPVRIERDRPQVALRRGRLAAEGDGHSPKGCILEPGRSFVVHEEEIPTGGVRV